MKKKIAILGSTGSIGTSLLKIVKENKKDFEIILLTANKNYKKLLNQTKTHNVKNVIITDFNCYLKFKKLNTNKNLKIFSNFQYFNRIFKSKLDYVMSSIIGLKGLNPTIKIIKHTKTIAIANKESIICGWNLIDKELKRNKTSFIPVDSEHFSIWYALKKNYNLNINKIVLTASGGPLLNIPLNKINKLKTKDIVKHPNWSMGKKISVDSSSMINKVFEIIEARNIFKINLDQLSILVHPKSYVHAILSFNDGMIKIIAHETTMEIPIFNSVYNNEKKYLSSKDINIDKINNLNFSKVNKNKFPLIKILSMIPDKLSLFETVLVSANDELVRLYLDEKIKYTDISKILLKTLKLNEFRRYKKIKPKKIYDIIKLDKYVRLKINAKSV